MSNDNSSRKYDPRPPSERREGRRQRGETPTRLQASDSLFSRMTGRAELDRAKAKRYEPYGYESNKTQLRWTIIALALFAVVALALAWQDRSTASTLSELSASGIRTALPTNTSTADFADFATREGIECLNEDGLIILSDGCSKLLDARTRFIDEVNVGLTLTVALLALLLGAMFAFGSFTHRASRNLLTLKSAEQGFTPEKGVFWFFIPIMNLVKPWQVYRELFKGSDPSVPTDHEIRWKTEGKVPAIVAIWALVFVGVFFFNPRTISMIWMRVRESVDDSIGLYQRLVIADILLAVLAIAAIFVVLELHRRQEAKHKIVGDVIVTPPLPVDPLEEALKEGIRRKERERRTSRRGAKGN